MKETNQVLFSKDRLSGSDSEFLLYLRSFSIFIIVFAHVGGVWVFRPYSEILHVFVPIFFFISGALSFFSYNRSENTILYYKNRFIGLLVPYYLICILSLLVFIVINLKFPAFDIDNFVKWIQIRPSNSIMPFPVGQVWFLHTLFIISLVSPIYFKIQKRNKNILFFLMGIFLVISGIQLHFNVSEYLHVFGNDLYKPLIHSTFYIFGIICFSSQKIRTFNFLMIICCSGIGFSILLVLMLNLKIDYAFHTYAPDLYYVLGSYSAIAFALLVKNHIISIVRNIAILKYLFGFFHTHMFSIFLLHTFAIYLVENLGGLVEPGEKTILYGISKLSIVLITTFLLAIPYTKLSKAISLRLLRIMVD